MRAAFEFSTTRRGVAEADRGVAGVEAPRLRLSAGLAAPPASARSPAALAPSGLPVLIAGNVGMLLLAAAAAVQLEPGLRW